MPTYEIPGIPVAWAAARITRCGSYNPHKKEKEMAKWELKLQHGVLPLFTTPLWVDFYFEMPLPKNMPKKLIKQIESGKKIYHQKKPDICNLRKHAEDALTGIIIKDDNIVVEGWMEKYYSLTPRTIIVISELNLNNERIL